MADLLVIMRDGGIEQAAPAMHVYHDPKTSFVAGFLGDPPRTLLDVELGRSGDRLVAKINGAELVLPDRLKSAADLATNRQSILALPSRAFTIAEDSDSGTVLDGTVRAHEMIEDAQRIVLNVSGQRVNLRGSPSKHVVNGDRLSARADAAEAMLFDRATGLRLKSDQNE
ncbi:MAG: hypothetical protein GY798_17730 [Hyphomicrobiales bacterium]|nr:hypothetical protein [Hyphomicrobiales bacterium]